jgi:hydroxymethylbilane synthase
MIETPLAVGIMQNEHSSSFETFLTEMLQKTGIKAHFASFSNQEAAFKAVTEGKIATFVTALEAVPTTLPLGLVIAALAERTETRYSLLTASMDVLTFDTTKTAKVLTLSGINQAQMQYLQPNFEVIKAEMSLQQGLEAVHSGEFDALVLSQTELNAANLTAAESHIQPFSVREFIPKAGHNIPCFVAAEDDLPTRRLLQTAHHSSVSAVTNIERTVQKLLKDHEVCAYCERDRMGNYHLWAAALIDNVLHRTRLSQSTSFGMAEKAVEQLFSA